MGRLLSEEQGNQKFFNYSKADWPFISERCNKNIEEVNGEATVEEWNSSLCEMIMRSANESIPIKKTSKRKIRVPCWSKDCDKAVRDRNPGYRALRKCPTEDKAVEYNRLRPKHAECDCKKGVLEKILWKIRGRDSSMRYMAGSTPYVRKQ